MSRDRARGSVLPLILLVLASCAADPPRATPPTTTTPGLSWQDAKLLAEAIDRLQADYVDEVASRALVRDALRGMLNGLDAHSTYLSPEEYAALDEYTDSTLPGAPSAPVDVAPIDPASRPDATPSSRVASVIGMLPRPGLAHLRVFQFNAPTAREIAREIARLRAAGPLHGVVLDLRGNPGGVFDAAVDTADLFLTEGVIVTSAGRAPGSTFERSATAGDVLDGARLIVIIDGVTASAAEIVAGALQDRHRALVLGTRSFGKGSVQSVIPLRSGGAIKFTTARYRLPSGRSIEGQGIEPDLPLSASQAKGAADPALDFALERALDALAATRK